MSMNISRGMLKRMEERNIQLEDVDETIALPQSEDHKEEERRKLTRDTERGLRAAYGQKERS